MVLVVLVCPACLAVLLVVCLSGVVCVRCGGGASRFACRGFGMAGRQHMFFCCCPGCVPKRGDQFLNAEPPCCGEDDMTLGQISWRPWLIGTADHEGFCFCRRTTWPSWGGVVPAAGALTCSPPPGLSSGRTPCVSWPGRDRGGVQVAGAGLSVGLARFVVVRCFTCSQGYDPGSMWPGDDCNAAPA